MNFRELVCLKQLARVGVEIATLIFARFLADKRRSHGVLVWLFIQGEERQRTAMGSIDVAMSLIRDRDELSYRRVRRHLRRILVVEAGFIEYRPTIKAVTLPVDAVLEQSSVQLALAFVHEAAHGRLFAAGIQPKRWDQERLEALCIRREISFATHLAGCAESIADQLQAKLRKRWWEPESQKPRARRELKKLRARGPDHDGDQ